MKDLEVRFATETHGSWFSGHGIVACAVLALACAGCGAGDAPADFGMHEHFDIAIASTEAGGGALAAEYDFSQPVEVPFSQCVAGSGPNCDGGLLLYSAEDPGLVPLEADEPEESLFVLPEGTPVTLVLTRASMDASYFINGVALSEVDDSVLLGEAIEGLHLHGAWQIVLVAGTEPPADIRLGFKLTTTSPAYSESEEFIVTLVPTAGAEETP